MKVIKRLTIQVSEEEAHAMLEEFEEVNIGCDDGKGSNDDKCPHLAELNELLHGEL